MGMLLMDLQLTFAFLCLYVCRLRCVLCAAESVTWQCLRPAPSAFQWLCLVHSITRAVFWAGAHAPG